MLHKVHDGLFVGDETECRLPGEAAEIGLTQGKKAIVDASDLDLLSEHSWCARRHQETHSVRWYAATRMDRQLVYMHRLLLGLTAGDPGVDHRDGDGLNNRRWNLRLATASQNGANTLGQPTRRRSRFKGVHQLKNGRWLVHITVGYKAIFRYSIKTEMEAARLYNELARHHFGEYARLNEVADAG